MTATYAAALDTVEAILERGGDADDVLRAVVDAVHRATGSWVGIAFVEEGALVNGPEAGEPPGGDATAYPVSFGGATVAELRTPGEPDHLARFLERIAVLLGPYCLVGWDTGGERWEP